MPGKPPDAGARLKRRKRRGRSPASPFRHPDKLYFPGSRHHQARSRALLRAIGDWILPHVEDRPLRLVRCPDGWNKQCFYQKHADKSVNAAVTRIEVPEGGGTATYLVR